MKRVMLYTLISMMVMSLVVQAQDFSIVIDAEKDSWYDQLTGPEDGMVFMPAACYLRDVGTEAPDDDDDMSAIVWFSYDDVYLYCYTEITDDVVLVSSGTRYLNDGIELKMDPEPAAGAATGNSHCRLTALGADQAQEPNGVDNLNGSSGLRDLGNVVWVPTEEDYARKLLDNGYALEFRIPLDQITIANRALEYNETGIFGMAINIADNDKNDRENMLQWSAGHADAAHNIPELLGSVTFLDDHKLKFEAVSPMDPSIINENADEWYSNPNPVAVNDVSVKAGSYQLMANYPNPFNPTTNIQFQIPNNGHVMLSVYNSLGQPVATLVDKDMQSGLHQVSFDAALLPSGIYFYKIQSGSFVEMSKMLLLK